MSPDDPIPDDFACAACGKPLPEDAAEHPDGWPSHGFCNVRCALKDYSRMIMRDLRYYGMFPDILHLISRAFDEVVAGPVAVPRPLARIEVLKRGEGFLARLTDDKYRSDYGTSAAEAVGKLVMVWPEAVGVDSCVREIR